MNIEDTVKEILMDMLGLCKLPENENKLSTDLSADSLDNIEIIIEIENEYNIEISDEEIVDKTDCTVSELIQFVTDKLDN